MEPPPYPAHEATPGRYLHGVRQTYPVWDQRNAALLNVPRPCCPGGVKPSKRLGRAFLHCVELVQHLSGRHFDGLVTTADDGTQYFFVDPDIWTDLVASLWTEVWDVCAENHYDQGVCYPSSEDYSCSHDPLDVETMSSEGT